MGGFNPIEAMDPRKGAAKGFGFAADVLQNASKSGHGGKVMSDAAGTISGVLRGAANTISGVDNGGSLVTRQAPPLTGVDDPYLRLAAEMERNAKKLGRTRKSTFVSGQAAVPSDLRPPKKTLLGG